MALLAAALTGFLRKWVWILALEPIAIGVVIGETAAVPTSARRRRPLAWSYAYVFLLCGFSYLMAHVVFWISSSGIWPAQSFSEFLRSAPSATAAPFFQSVDFARQISLATGGATALKYWIWVVEGLLMAVAGALAYRGGSVRRLRT